MLASDGHVSLLDAMLWERIGNVEGEYMGLNICFTHTCTSLIEGAGRTSWGCERPPLLSACSSFLQCSHVQDAQTVHVGMIHVRKRELLHLPSTIVPEKNTVTNRK